MGFPQAQGGPPPPIGLGMPQPPSGPQQQFLSPSGPSQENLSSVGQPQAQIMLNQHQFQIGQEANARQMSEADKKRQLQMDL